MTPVTHLETLAMDDPLVQPDKAHVSSGWNDCSHSPLAELTQKRTFWSSLNILAYLHAITRLDMYVVDRSMQIMDIPLVYHSNATYIL
jgi:hypothetical protein